MWERHQSQLLHQGREGIAFRGWAQSRVRVSLILDQASDREVERETREELIALRARFIALEGEEPMKIRGCYR